MSWASAGGAPRSDLPRWASDGLVRVLVLLFVALQGLMVWTGKDAIAELKSTQLVLQSVKEELVSLRVHSELATQIHADHEHRIRALEVDGR